MLLEGQPVRIQVWKQEEKLVIAIIRMRHVDGLV